jgi:5-formyltetrahydrofolate cyclo-ligase
MTKQELRKIYIQKREDLENITFLSQQLCDIFFLKIDLSKIKVIHLYLPIKNKREVDTWHIAKRLWKEYPHITTVLPVSDFSTNTMLSVEVTKNTELIENSHGIPEPYSREGIDNKLIDLVLTPLLIFDKKGFRVGYGKGFYDRFFSDQCKKEVQKIGLSFFKPIENIENIDQHDVPLDTCIYLD